MSAWTITTLDSLEIGWRSTYISPNTRVTKIFAIVEFVPAAAGAGLDDTLDLYDEKAAEHWVSQLENPDHAPAQQ